MVGLAGASLAVEAFAWSDRHHGEPLAEAFHTPGREIQRLLATKEPSPEQLEVSLAAMAEILRAEPGSIDCRRMFGRIDHIGVAVEDLDAAIALYETSFEMELVHRETVDSQGVEAVLLDVGDGPRRAAAPARPRHRGRQIPRQATAPACTTSPTRSTTSTPTLPRLAAAGIELIDAEPRVGIRESRVAFLHPRSTGGVLTEIVEPAERALMAEAQRVEIGFEGGQVIQARLGDDDLKDLRKQLEKGGWHDLHTEDGVISLYLGKVAFLRVASNDHRVGFGSVD